jgi:urease accessory protein
MVVGGSLALSHASMPFVESGILASVLIMGLLVMFALRLPMPAAVALAGLFAIFHGYAHIAEMPPTASTFAYGSGFILASAALLAAGAALARLLTIARQLQWLRLFGGATAMAALLLAIS